MSWSGQSVGSSVGTRFLLFLTSVFGYYPAYLFLPFIALAYTLTSKESTQALVDFYGAIGVKPTLLRRWRHYYSYAISFLHRSGFFVVGTKGLKLVTVGEDMVAGLAQDSGVILLSAHIGGWEIGGNLLVSRIDTPVNILAADRDMGTLSSVNKELGSERKVSLISVDQDPLTLSLAIRDALDRKEIVAALGDRFVQGQGTVAVDFCGRQAHFPKGLFEVAMIAHVPIVPVFTLRSKVNTYTFKASAPLWIKPAHRKDRKSAIENAVRSYALEVEEVAKARPSQWYNFYPFWG